MRLGLALVIVAAAGCAGPSIPEPRDAARRYAEAAQRGDADALHAMLSADGRRTLSREDVRRLVADQRAELADRGKALEAWSATVKARARVTYGDGEHATLDLEPDGVFRVSAADALPAGARTPEQALADLRKVLARRSYAGLIRVLTPASRSALEADMRSLVEGLEQPEGLDVHVTGDSATVQVPGGHEVKLKRQGGVWRVEDFD